MKTKINITMKFIRLLGLVAFTGLAVTAVRASDASAPLTAAQQEFLQHYTAVHAALVHDDLAAAQAAAAAITTPPYAAPAQQLAQAKTLKSARNAFKMLSKEAVAIAKGHDGYHVAFCPMVPHDAGYWVQTSTTIANPYMGQKMPGCGSLAD